MQRLRKGLFLLEAGRFVNSYLIEGAHGLTLIDSGHSRGADMMVAEIKDAGFSLGDIEMVVLTHGHYDHAGATALLLQQKRVKVFAHPEDHECLKRPPRAPRGLTGWSDWLVQRFRYPFEPLEVILPIRQGQTIRSIPHWQVLDTPGHSPGSISLFQPTDRVLLCGDAVANDGAKLVLAPRTEDPDRAADSVKRLAELGVEMLCPGRGPVIRTAANRALDCLAGEFDQA